MNINIRPDFQSLIPPLAPEERALLEANLLADGCRDPLVTWNGTLLDGHNRLDICQRHGLKFRTVALKLPDEEAAKVWIIRNQFGRRNLAPFTRVELALKLEPLLASEAAKRMKAGKSNPVNKCSQGKTRDALGKIAGVSARLIDEGRLVAEHADEATKKRLRENQISVHCVAKDIKEKLQRDARKAKRTLAAKSAPMSAQIIVGDFRKHADKVADGSLSLIFTDPPYDKRVDELLSDLGAFAAVKLADGGSLICYIGQTKLMAAGNALAKHLRHWWTFCCLHAGHGTLMREFGLMADWKPMLWFVKGTRDDPRCVISDVVSGGKEKSHHDWQQAESEAAYCIEKLCPPDGIVCDPFLGSGTTAAAAKKLGRAWIGFEIDADTARIASQRIVE